MYQAKDVMTRRIVTVTPETTVEAAIATLLEHSISGVPVVNESREVVGIVSEFQLLEVIYDPEIKAERVADVMTRDVIAVTEDTLLSKIASLFTFRRIRRLPVIHDGRLVGLISRRDLLRYAVDHPGELHEFVQRTLSLPAV